MVSFLNRLCHSKGLYHFNPLKGEESQGEGCHKVEQTWKFNSSQTCLSQVKNILPTNFIICRCTLLIVLLYNIPGNMLCMLGMLPVNAEYNLSLTMFHFCIYMGPCCMGCDIVWRDVILLQPATRDQQDLCPLLHIQQATCHSHFIIVNGQI